MIHSEQRLLWSISPAIPGLWRAPAHLITLSVQSLKSPFFPILKQGLNFSISSWPWLHASMHWFAAMWLTDKIFALKNWCPDQYKWVTTQYLTTTNVNNRHSESLVLSKQRSVDLCFNLITTGLLVYQTLLLQFCIIASFVPLCWWCFVLTCRGGDEGFCDWRYWVLTAVSREIHASRILNWK